MCYQKVFETIEALDAEFRQVWVDVASIESPTVYKEGVDAVGAYFIKRAEANGWQVEILEQPVSGNAVCLTMNPHAKGAPVALSGHMDTVHAVGFFGTPAVRMDDGHIYGPGVTDCKGGIVAGFLAMEALHKCNFTDRPVMLILQSDEETSSKGSNKETIRWMCEKAKDCVAFLNLEPKKAGTVVLTRKGIIRYRLSIKGRAVHSSDCANPKMVSVNAIAEAAHKIIELEKYKDHHGLTFNCGVIEGGTTANSVPDACSVVVDIRYATEEQRHEAERIVHDVAAHAYVEGSSCVVDLVSARDAMAPSPKNDALYARMNEVFAETGLSALTRRHGNGGADAAYTTSAGIPTLDCLGTIADRVHSKEEMGYLASLASSAKRLAALVMKL
jgi:glutamate carboxypeptidase